MAPVEKIVGCGRVRRANQARTSIITAAAAATAKVFRDSLGVVMDWELFPVVEVERRFMSPWASSPKPSLLALLLLATEPASTLCGSGSSPAGLSPKDREISEVATAL